MYLSDIERCIALTKTNDNWHGHMIESVIQKMEVSVVDKTVITRLFGYSCSLIYLTTFMQVWDYFKVAYF